MQDVISGVISFHLTLYIVCLFFVLWLQIKNHNRFNQPLEMVDFFIIFGCAVNEDKTPSYPLELRLEKLLELAVQVPKAQLIVSGAKGSDEPISEAEAMQNYLIAKGIASDRIIIEDQSYSTRENVWQSLKFIPENKHICVVSSNYHLPRIYYIFSKNNRKCSGVGAKTELTFKEIFREPFAIIIDVFVRKVRKIN
ncbi:MAG: YdcF family protein [Mycoplasmatales bacterium]